jgi:hypothetical protein
MKLSSASMMALTFTGAVAPTLPASAQNKFTATHANALPIPSCPVDDPTICGPGLPTPDDGGRSIKVGD